MRYIKSGRRVEDKVLTGGDAGLHTAGLRRRQGPDRWSWPRLHTGSLGFLRRCTLAVSLAGRRWRWCILVWSVFLVTLQNSLSTGRQRYTYTHLFFRQCHAYSRFSTGNMVKRKSHVWNVERLRLVKSACCTKQWRQSVVVVTWRLESQHHLVGSQWNYIISNYIDNTIKCAFNDHWSDTCHHLIMPM